MQCAETAHCISICQRSAAQPPILAVDCRYLKPPLQMTAACHAAQVELEVFDLPLENVGAFISKVSIGKPNFPHAEGFCAS